MFDLLNALHELNNLTEDLLIEGIDDVKKYYPNIDDNKFNELIALDPTFQQGKDKLGNYGKWILNLYKQNKLKEEDFYKVTDYLTKFNNKKNNFENKDIGQFKSLPDLAQALDNTGDVEKTDRQIRRDKTKSKDYDVVFEDDKWTIYIPKTYGASRMLGDGTHWCTASSNDKYYNKYTEQGPLYILISKHDPTEKYQFHFESKQFTDKYDSGILKDVDEKINDDKVFDFFMGIIPKKLLPLQFINFNNLSKKEINTLINRKDNTVRSLVAKRGYGLDKLINDEDWFVRRAVAKQNYKLGELINDKAYQVRMAVAEQGYGLDKLINDKNEYVRAAVAKQRYGLNKLVNDDNYVVRRAVAQQGYGLDKLVNDEDWFVRMAVAEQGYGLDKLVNDEQYDVRVAVAKQGYGLDKLVNDESEWVRKAVAQQGYGLDKLVNDSDASIRMAVAEQGYGLDKLVNDDDWFVRAAVAKQGYGLDKLIKDKNSDVRYIAKQELAKRKQ